MTPKTMQWNPEIISGKSELVGLILHHKCLVRWISFGSWVFSFYCQAVLVEENRKLSLVTSYNCSQEKFRNNSNYQSNRMKLFSSFQSMADTRNFRFNISHNGEIFGLIQCYGNVSDIDGCHFCVTNAQNTLQEKCGEAESAYVWADNCFLRYGRQNFTSILDSSTKMNCNERSNGPQPKKLATIVGKVLVNTTIGSLNAVAALDDFVVYGKAEYSLDLSETDRERCLEELKFKLKRNCSKLEIWSASCSLKYWVIYPDKVPVRQQQGKKRLNDNAQYRNPVGAPIPPSDSVTTQAHPVPDINQRNSNNRSIWSILIGALLVLILLALFSLVILLKKNILRWRWRLLLHNDRHREFTGIRIYPYELLRHATRNFHEADKLGEGAYGSVYKGILPDGTQIAVKRLKVHTKHGNDQFVNEANLISNVQHRNLVKLLGCCAERSEKLLVYEYLPNKSLDKIVFSAEIGPSLDWNRRKSIIVGVARGLAYLHEESQPRIVHRDIKAGNILLDDNYNAKISDFGLARLFPEYDSHVSTRVAGTFGYVAPEYALRGQLTEKADIFSFGVLLLEILSGRQNLDIALSPHRQFLLEWAWKLYELRDFRGIVDPKMNGNYQREDIERSIQIAFLCVQGKAQVRPSMSQVVGMMTSSQPIEVYPQKPAVLEMISYVNTNSGHDSVAISTSYSASFGGAASSSVSSDISSFEPR